MLCSFQGNAAIAYPSPGSSSVKEPVQASLTPSLMHTAHTYNNNPATPGSTSDHGVDAISLPARPSQQQGFSHLDLELIHYYSTQTYMTLTSKLTAHLVWRDVIFQEGLKHNFLLHALMATAALHKATNHAEDSETHSTYIKVAFQYQNLALSGYIPELNRPNEDNAIALFILSALLTIWLFGSKKLPEALTGVHLSGSPGFLPQILRSGFDGNKSTDFLEILTLVQGINAVVKQTIHWLRGGVIDPLLKPPRESELPPNPPDIESSFSKLRLRIESLNVDQAQLSEQAVIEQREIYLERLTNLRHVARARTVLEHDQQVFAWPVTSEAAFLDLIRQSEPIAIALFIHWSAIFRTLEHLWWAKGWSFRLVKDASLLLDASWADVLAWPRKEVGLN